jgi:hypothetical protein
MGVPDAIKQQVRTSGIIFRHGIESSLDPPDGAGPADLVDVKTPFEHRHQDGLISLRGPAELTDQEARHQIGESA